MTKSGSSSIIIKMGDDSFASMYNRFDYLFVPLTIVFAFEWESVENTFRIDSHNRCHSLLVLDFVLVGQDNDVKGCSDIIEDVDLEPIGFYRVL